MANPTTLYKLQDGRTAVNVTENKTLAITDQGVVQNVIADGIVITLPATVVGYTFTVRNGGEAPTDAPVGAGSNQSAEVTLAMATDDLIAGGQITAADNKDYVNTQATAEVGDEVTIVGNGTTGWNILSQRGIWEREE